MSAETERNEVKQSFKRKRKLAEILNFLYYFTIFPFVFHHIYKVFYHALTRSKRLKLSSEFKEAGDQTTINERFKLRGGTRSRDRKVLQKISSKKRMPEESETYWFAKAQNLYGHITREIVTEGVFRLLAGKQHAAKSRLMKDQPTGKIYSISKLFKNFQTTQELLEKYSLTEEDFCHWNKHTNYYHAYKKITQDVQGYEAMLVITLLLGRYDCGEPNWGVITEKNNRFAATFDYGEATTWNVVDNLDRLLQNNGHFYERVVTKKFLGVCEKIIEQFEGSHDQVEAELLKGIEAAEAAYPWWKWAEQIPTANEIMRIFTNNKRALKHLCRHIRAELAITENNANDFASAVEKLDHAYKFPILSTQSRVKFIFRPNSDFITLINNEYLQLFLCRDKLPEKTNLREKAMYLQKDEYGAQICLHQNKTTTFEILCEKQCSEIEKLLIKPLPENNCHEITDSKLRSQIFSICRVPEARDPAAKKALSAAYEAYQAKKAIDQASALESKWSILNML